MAKLAVKPLVMFHALTVQIKPGNAGQHYVGCVAHTLAMVTTKAHAVAASEARRARYLATLMKTKNDRKARVVSGLKSRSTKQRIQKRLAEYGSLADQPRTGRPVTITKAAQQKAWEIIVSKDSPLLTGSELLSILKDEGLVPANSAVHTLVKHLKTYAHSLGHQLMMNVRGTIFALLKTDAPTRVQFSKDLLDLIDEVGLDNIWFEDETTEEEYPHPKGIL
jgi:transposase